MKRIKSAWQSLFGDVDRRVRLGRVVGFVFMTAGVILIGLAWNGAASRNFVEGQFPYLLSGGFMGLALVTIGASLLFLATVRAERQLMTDRFDEMIRLLGRNLNRLSVSSNGTGGSSRQVVAGETTFHRAECKVLQGKEGLATISLEQAEAEGLEPCRVCSPPRTEKSEKKDDDRSADGAKTEVMAGSSSSSGSGTQAP